jgi:hypothetical protein
MRLSPPRIAAAASAVVAACGCGGETDRTLDDAAVETVGSDGSTGADGAHPAEGGDETATCATPGSGDVIPCGDAACPAASTYCYAFDCSPHCVDAGGPGDHWTYSCHPLPPSCGGCPGCDCIGDAVACACTDADAGLVEYCYAY